MSSKILGLVIRRRPLGDNDLILTVLCREFGKINCIAKGVLKSKKSPLYAQIFAYSELSLYRGKSFYIIESADLREPFYGLRQSLDALYLGQYFAEVADTLPQGSSSGEEGTILKLLLNSLFLLCKNPSEEDCLRIKIVFEVKYAQISGFFPDISGCEACGGSELAVWDFTSGFFCAACGNGRHGKNISQTVVRVFDHILASSQNAAYSFSVSKELFAYISRLTGQYLSSVLDAEFKSLNWYESLK